MFGKILGTLDLTSVLLILLMHFGIFLNWRILMFHVAFLVFKGVIFRDDWNSILDIAIGFYMILMVFGISTFVDWIWIMYLGQKGLISVM
ncbi:MAG: hypothetical protein ACE5DM_00895 [Candidatus Nanoarchaeia archaeon]